LAKAVFVASHWGPKTHTFYNF